MSQLSSIVSATLSAISQKDFDQAKKLAKVMAQASNDVESLVRFGGSASFRSPPVPPPTARAFLHNIMAKCALDEIDTLSLSLCSPEGTALLRSAQSAIDALLAESTIATLAASAGIGQSGDAAESPDALLLAFHGYCKQGKVKCMLGSYKDGAKAYAVAGQLVSRHGGVLRIVLGEARADAMIAKAKEGMRRALLGMTAEKSTLQRVATVPDAEVSAAADVDDLLVLTEPDDGGVRRFRVRPTMSPTPRDLAASLIKFDRTSTADDRRRTVLAMIGDLARSEEVRRPFLECGVARLVADALVDATTGHRQAEAGAAARCIGNLCFDCSPAAAFFRDVGSIPRLLGCLSSPDEATVRTAAAALANAATVHDEVRASLVADETLVSQLMASVRAHPGRRVAWATAEALFDGPFCDTLLDRGVPTHAVNLLTGSPLLDNEAQVELLALLRMLVSDGEDKVSQERAARVVQAQGLPCALADIVEAGPRVKKKGKLPPALAAQVAAQAGDQGGKQAEDEDVEDAAEEAQKLLSSLAKAASYDTYQALGGIEWLSRVANAVSSPDGAEGAPPAGTMQRDGRAGLMHVASVLSADERVAKHMFGDDVCRLLLPLIREAGDDARLQMSSLALLSNVCRGDAACAAIIDGTFGPVVDALVGVLAMDTEEWRSTAQVHAADMCLAALRNLCIARENREAVARAHWNTLGPALLVMLELPSARLQFGAVGLLKILLSVSEAKETFANSSGVAKLIAVAKEEGFAATERVEGGPPPVLDRRVQFEAARTLVQVAVGAPSAEARQAVLNVDEFFTAVGVLTTAPFDVLHCELLDLLEKHVPEKPARGADDLVVALRTFVSTGMGAGPTKERATAVLARWT